MTGDKIIQPNTLNQGLQRTVKYRHDLQNYRESEIFWDGHLCEGDNMVTGDPDTFILWTRCGNKDVPADKGHVGPKAPDDITCDECLKIWNDENGQFGMGA